MGVGTNPLKSFSSPVIVTIPSTQLRLRLPSSAISIPVAAHFFSFLLDLKKSPHASREDQQVEKHHHYHSWDVDRHDGSLGRLLALWLMPCFVKALKLLHTTATNKYPWRNILQDSVIPSGCGHGFCIQLICKQIEEVKSMFGKESIDVCSSRHFINLFYYYSWTWALLEWFFFVCFLHCDERRIHFFWIGQTKNKQTNK